jgi:protein-S-isoprenylcysteine O-methyltransferase Ste14
VLTCHWPFEPHVTDEQTPVSTLTYAHPRLSVPHSVPATGSRCGQTGKGSPGEPDEPPGCAVATGDALAEDDGEGDELDELELPVPSPPSGAIFPPQAATAEKSPSTSTNESGVGERIAHSWPPDGDSATRPRRFRAGRRSFHLVPSSSVLLSVHSAPMSAAAPPAPPPEAPLASNERPESPPVSSPSPVARPLSPPPSAESFALNCIALVSVIGMVYAIHEVPALNKLPVPVRVSLVALATVLPVGVLDLLVLKVHRRPSTGLDWDKPFDLNLERVFNKLTGLAVTLAVIAFAYWVFPEYHGSFYDSFFGALLRWWPALSVTAVLYTIAVDGVQKAPRDTYWQIGRWILGNPEDLKPAEVANHARGWLVKAFFLPLMFTYFYNDVSRLTTFNFAGVTWENLRLYQFTYDFVFMVDVAFCSMGYILALRIWDSHVRSAEPTMFGWAVALFCYMPFFSMFDKNYVQYEGPGFGNWLTDYPLLKGAWAGLVVALIVIYVLATVGFGWRFSNLTNRGILTNGMYRFTKHPAYVSKNLSWWLSSVPFVAITGTGFAGKILCLRHCVMLACVNTIYFLRARTEERHLSRDPTYVAYALWMNDHGALRFLGRWFPSLRYVPPPSSGSASS